MLRAVWVDESTPETPFALDADKCRRHGITAPYFSHREAGLTDAYLDSVKAQGFTPGVYSAWNWFPELGAADYARHLDAELRRIGWSGNPPVSVDIETHDVGYLLAFFKTWRELRPTRPTSWTMEAFQGGLFNAAQVAELEARNLRYAVQLYNGDMSEPPMDPILDWMCAGFSGERTDGFYDGQALRELWRGFVFTQARLP